MNRCGTDDKMKIILTTPTYSIGINYFDLCYVILTENPDDMQMYEQMVGRSNRVDFKAKKNVVFVNDEYQS